MLFQAYSYVKYNSGSEGSDMKETKTLHWCGGTPLHWLTDWEVVRGGGRAFWLWSGVTPIGSKRLIGQQLPETRDQTDRRTTQNISQNPLQ